MAETAQTVPALMVALQRGKILIPAAVAAEVIPYEPLQRIEDTPDWFLGVLGWRGLRIPVISYESLTSKRTSFSLVSVASASLIIVRTLRTRDDIPFYAMVSQAAPDEIQVSEETLTDSMEELEDTELARAKIGNTVVGIPDMEFIEASLNEVDFS
ncbi:MAG: chemotaxis protein CheW [Gammaproteobacteria bacterium]|nr:chemotaxis protein CheW [Gammaproteobacteria bacterium]